MRRFRRASRLAVAATALLILFWESAAPSAAPKQGGTPSPPPTEAVEQATGTLQQLLAAFFEILPKVAIAAGILLAAYLVSRLVHPLLRRLMGSWNRASAVSAVVNVSLFLVSVGVALSVVAGDVRALVGSVGLVGLALSWALQTPIESFTGWLLNSFKGYYRVGDRIEVGDVFGDVYRIDVLTTTVWEAGGAGKSVQAAQPTGALVTFPNSEVLRSNVVNYTQDFAYVWDEITLGVANESDMQYAMQTVQRVAADLIGPTMREQAPVYARLLRERGLPGDVDPEPSVYMSPTDAWTNLTLRYLVEARSRRKWASALHLKISQELAKPEHAGRIVTSYPRTQVQLLGKSDEG